MSINFSNFKLSDSICIFERFMENVPEVIHNIEDNINGIYKAFSDRKHWINSEINYFEEANKNLLSLRSSLDMLRDQQKKLRDLEISRIDLPLGLLISKLQPNFNEYQEAVAFTLQELKKLKADLMKNYNDFQRDASSSIFQIKEATKACCDKEAKEPKGIVGTRNLLNSGKSMHSSYLNMYNTISKSQTSLYESIKEKDKALKELLSKENEIIAAPSLLFNQLFYLSDFREVQRAEEELINTFYPKIKKLFYDLYSATGNTTPAIHSIFVSLESQTPFVSRIWDDYSVNDPQNELTVKKKEFVTVVRATLNTHWKIANSKGQSGMVPAAIIEPMPLCYPVDS